MLLSSFLIYATLSGLAAVSTTANAKQIQSKLITDELEQDLYNNIMTSLLMYRMQQFR
jgi:hypothetical protein